MPIAKDNLVDITDFSNLAANFNGSIDPSLDTGADATGDGLQGGRFNRLLGIWSRDRTSAENPGIRSAR
jgi:hypothetical protein